MAHHRPPLPHQPFVGSCRCSSLSSWTAFVSSFFAFRLWLGKGALVTESRDIKLRHDTLSMGLEYLPTCGWCSHALRVNGGQCKSMIFLIIPAPWIARDRSTKLHSARSSSLLSSQVRLLHMLTKPCDTTPQPIIPEALGTAPPFQMDLDNLFLADFFAVLGVRSLRLASCHSWSNPFH